jgi:parallel beta-helix repeat protein
LTKLSQETLTKTLISAQIKIWLVVDMKRMNRFSFVLLTSLLLISFVLAVNFVNAEVSQSATIIQALIDSANSGDTVNVPAGYYTGGVTINKSIRLVGQGNSLTTIDANLAGRAIIITAGNVEISGFTIKNSPKGMSAIYASNQANIKINNNYIVDNAGGLMLEQCSSAKIQNNYFYHNNYMGYGAAAFRTCPNLEFSNNTVRKNASIGVSFDNCQECIIDSNQIVDNNELMSGDPVVPSGLGVWNSNHMTVSNNNITNNAAHGLSGTGMANSVVFKNYLIGNKIGFSDSGWTAKGNKVYENIIQSNEQGFYLQQTSDNLFYHNNIINNTKNFGDLPPVNVTRGPNAWDIGYPSGGNFWSDYRGNDANNDGIGDSPYIIDSYNNDTYPLMQPFGAVSEITPTPSPTQSEVQSGGGSSKPASTSTPTPKSTAKPTESHIPKTIQTPQVTPRPSPTEVSQNSMLPLSTLVTISCIISAALIPAGMLFLRNGRTQGYYSNLPYTGFNSYSASNGFTEASECQIPAYMPYSGDYEQYPSYNPPTNYDEYAFTYSCPYCRLPVKEHQHICGHCYRRIN